MTQPGTPGGQIPVTDLDGLARRLRDMERKIASLEANTIGPNGYVIGDRASIKTVDFDGTDFAHPGTKGVYLASEAGVGKLIVNDVLLRGGIIGNDALANPLDAGQFTGSAGSTFGLSTTSNTIVYSGTITIPAGFTRANVSAQCVAQGVSVSGSYDFLYARCYIAGSGGPRGVQGATPGATISAPAQHAVALTGLVGGATITVAVAAWTGFTAWPGPGGNDAALTATALFRR